MGGRVLREWVVGEGGLDGYFGEHIFFDFIFRIKTYCEIR